MVTFETNVRVEGIVAYKIYRFLLDPGRGGGGRCGTGVGLAFRVVRHRPGETGSLVQVDQVVGRRRIRARAVVTEAIPGRRLTLRLRRLVRLPAWIALEFEDRDGGVDVTHSFRVGYRGAGVLLDPILRLWFSRRFARELDALVSSGFPSLGERLYVDTSEW